MTFKSIQTHVSDGTLQSVQFSIDFLNTSHLHFYVNDVEITTSTTSQGIAVDSVDEYGVTLTAAVPSGAVFKVLRQTPRDNVPHVFATGAALFTALTTDANNEYLLYVVQETYEQSGQGPFPTITTLAGTEYLVVETGGVRKQITAQDFLASVPGVPQVLTDLADTTDPAKGPGMMGFSDSLTYPEGTAGRAVRAALSGMLHSATYGHDLSAMLDAASVLGGKVKLILERRTYDITDKFSLEFPANTAYMTDYVTIEGDCMAVLADDGNGFVEGSGTIIKGLLFARAHGFVVKNLSVDVGPEWVVAHGGVHNDGLVIGLQDYPTATTLYKDCAVENVSVLLGTPTDINTSWRHGMLFENVTGMTLRGALRAYRGYHGIVFKGEGFQAGAAHLFTKGPTADAVIIKSQTNLVSKRSTIGPITMEQWSSRGDSMGIRLEGGDGITTEYYQIGPVRGFGMNRDIFCSPTTGAISNFHFESVQSDLCSSDSVTLNEHCKQITIGSHTINNPAGYGIIVNGDAERCCIGNGSVINAGASGYSMAGATNTHGKISAVGCGAWGFIAGADYGYNYGDISGYNNTSGFVSNLKTLLSSSDLQNAWVNNGDGVWPFQVILNDNVVHVRGMVKNGTASTIATLPVGYRPGFILTFVTACVIPGTGRTFAHIDVMTDGRIVCQTAGAIGSSAAVSLNFSYLF